MFEVFDSRVKSASDEEARDEVKRDLGSMAVGRKVDAQREGARARNTADSRRCVENPE